MECLKKFSSQYPLSGGTGGPKGESKPNQRATWAPGNRVWHISRMTRRGPRVSCICCGAEDNQFGVGKKALEDMCSRRWSRGDTSISEWIQSQFRQQRAVATLAGGEGEVSGKGKEGRKGSFNRSPLNSYFWYSVQFSNNHLPSISSLQSLQYTKLSKTDSLLISN